MTDPIADLRRHLMDAAERDVARPRRFPALPRPQLRPLLVFAATAAASIAALVGIATVFGGGGDAERAASPQTQKTPLSPEVCVDGEGSTGRELGPVPDELRRRFAPLRRAAGAQDRFELPPRMRQIGGIYEDGLRVARTADGRRYVMLAAAVISRRDVTRDDPKQDVCAGGGTPAAPGLCLFAAEDDGEHLSACYTVKEIDTGDGFLDISRPDRLLFAGFAPDGADEAILVATGERFRIQENVYVGVSASDDPQVLQGGEAKIAFVGPGRVDTCGKPRVDGPVPDVIRSHFAIFDRDEKDGGEWPFFPEVARYYEDGTRSLGEAGGARFHVVAAEIRPDARSGNGAPGCAALEQMPTAPGLCLYSSAQQAKPEFACWTVDELRAKPFFLEFDRRQLIAGIAPDGVRAVEVQRPGVSAELVVTDNFFAAPHPGGSLTPQYLR